MIREPTDAEKIAAVKRALREMNDERRLEVVRRSLDQVSALRGQYVTPAVKAVVKAKAATRLCELVEQGAIGDYHDLEVIEPMPGEIQVNVTVEPPASVNFPSFRSAPEDTKP